MNIFFVIVWIVFRNIFSRFSAFKLDLKLKHFNYSNFLVYFLDENTETVNEYKYQIAANIPPILMIFFPSCYPKDF